MFVLTLTATRNDHEEIPGTFRIEDGGVLRVFQDGMVPRIYSPSAWLMVEDFSEPRATPVIDDVRLG